MVFCTIKGCKSYSLSSEVSFHRFPKDPERRRDWLLALNMDPDQRVGQKSVCCLHFKNEHFRRIHKRNYLLKCAVPSITYVYSYDKEVNSINNDINPLIESEEIVIDNEENVEDTIDLTSEELIKQRRQFVQAIHSYASTRDRTKLKSVKSRNGARDRKRIQTLADRLNRMKSNIKDLKSIIRNLKKQDLLTETAYEHIEEWIAITLQPQ